MCERINLRAKQSDEAASTSWGTISFSRTLSSSAGISELRQMVGGKWPCLIFRSRPHICVEELTNASRTAGSRARPEPATSRSRNLNHSIGKLGRRSLPTARKYPELIFNGIFPRSARPSSRLSPTCSDLFPWQHLKQNPFSLCTNSQYSGPQTVVSFPGRGQTRSVTCAASTRA